MIQTLIKSKLIWVFASFLLIIAYWVIIPVERLPFVLDVPRWGSWPVLESKNAYFYLLLACLLPVLALSFDRRVHYHTDWKCLFKPMIWMGIPFIIWDILKTYYGVWGFSDTYTLGLKILGLPLEEWSFFIIVPFCCVFIHQCLAYYFPEDYLAKLERPISWFLLLFMLAIAIFHTDKAYTFSNFMLGAIFQAWHLFTQPAGQRSRFYLTFLVSTIPFFLVNGILTGILTQTPIVIYHPDEYLGIRMITIPVEDLAYGYTMLLAVVTGFDYNKNKASLGA
jgi:lycopene cyclase domain-containing protein